MQRLIMTVFLLFVAILSDSQPARSQACPNFVIEGFGRNTTGGCGGTVYTVTNLNNSGPGSLRDFVSRSGPRIVKFAVSGVITLQSDLYVTNPNITIDGSDAPNGGIGIRGAIFGISTDNVIVRHLRIGSGELGTTSIDSVQVYGASNVVLDHLSVRWGDDGNIDITNGSHDVTVQWSILSENLGSGHNLIKYGATRITLHHNLYTQGSRNPEMGGGDVEFVNNVFYRNWSGNFENLSTIPPDTSPVRLNMIGNYYKAGSNQRIGPNYNEVYLYGDRPYSGQSSAYFLGNISPKRPNDTLPQTQHVEMDGGGFAIASSRHNFPQVTTVSAQQAYSDVLAGAGAMLPCRDAVDKRVIDDVINGTGAHISNESQVGGWSNLTQPCGATGQQLAAPSNLQVIAQ